MKIKFILPDGRTQSVDCTLHGYRYTRKKTAARRIACEIQTAIDAGGMMADDICLQAFLEDVADKCGMVREYRKMGLIN